MASVTNSPASNDPLPLLVLRVPEFEQIAWREGKHAARRLERTVARVFYQAAGRVLRSEDLRLHEAGSDVFAVVVVAAARGPAHPRAAICRAMLERIAGTVSAQTGLRVETGWTTLRTVSGWQAAIEAALERGAREKERYEFFAAIGHELRTPLASIRGYLETVIDGGVDSPTSRRFLQTAQREALRMGRLLDGMFEFSLLDLSADVITRSCTLEEQIALACDVVAPLARTRGITCHPELGQGRHEVAIDPDACLQLLVNLLENAAKYGRDGGTIRISVQSRGGTAAILVDDDGPGVSAAERTSIFQLRVRGSENSARAGAGIGLAIVKLIAERADGTVAVSESPLGGARFEVVLPAKAEFCPRPS